MGALGLARRKIDPIAQGPLEMGPFWEDHIHIASQGEIAKAEKERKRLRNRRKRGK